MWSTCLILSLGALVLTVVFCWAFNKSKAAQRHKLRLVHALPAGVFLATVFMLLPIHVLEAGVSTWDKIRAIFVSVFQAMQVLTIGCDFNVVAEGTANCPAELSVWYRLLAAVLFVLAPIFTFGFVLSLFKNLSAYLRYCSLYFREVYAFSELNEKSLALATDIRDASKKKDKKVTIVFTDVFEDNKESVYELVESAKKCGAICFKKDLLAVDFKLHSRKKPISFFAIGSNETENLNQALKLIEQYKKREHTHLYVFSTKIESELLLTALDKGMVKVRRINEVQSLVNRVLYERGNVLFDHACEVPDGGKKISAVVVGMGSHGTEMVKALTWFGQMDGYKLEINAFDVDPLAEERFVALAPNLWTRSITVLRLRGKRSIA